MKLEERKTEMNAKQRSLSSHVGSRWYRPPEITLILKQYDSSSDLWSLGCCLFELMMVTSGQNLEAIKDLNPSQKKMSQILFPGECCYPLSPKISKKDGKPEEQILQDKDQLRITVEKLGKIEDIDLSFITHDEAKNYVKVLDQQA
jgi:serine/threonine protein kinase